jgi:hypothetical protein
VKWTEPAWMRPYVEHLANTGGWITPAIAMNCRGDKDGCDLAINGPRALLCTAVHSQVRLLERLHAHGLLHAAPVPD